MAWTVLGDRVRRKFPNHTTNDDESATFAAQALLATVQPLPLLLRLCELAHLSFPALMVGALPMPLHRNPPAHKPLYCPSLASRRLWRTQAC